MCRYGSVADRSKTTPAALISSTSRGLLRFCSRVEPNACRRRGKRQNETRKISVPPGRADENLQTMKQIATITVIGEDKTGVVARVTGFLFEQGANIEGLEEQVTRKDFSMTIQASWKQKAWHPERVRTGLEELASALGMEIRMQCVEAHRRQRFALLVTKESHVAEAMLAGCRS